MQSLVRNMSHQLGHTGLAGLASAVALGLVLSVPLSPLSFGHAHAAGGTTAGRTISAFAGGFGPNGGYDIGVFQSTGTNPATSLWYGQFTIDTMGNFNLVEGGYGTIPNSAVQSSGGSKPTSVSLSIDTSTLGGSFTRFGGTGGVISLSWSATPDYSSSGSGTESGQFGPYYSFQISGSHYSTSAAANGTLIGMPVPNPNLTESNAGMSSSEGMQVCRGEYCFGS